MKKSLIFTLSLLSVSNLSFAVTINQNTETLSDSKQKVEQFTQDTNVTNTKDSQFANIEVSGLIEVETFYSSPEFGGSDSDTTIATVELGIASDITNNINAAIVLLFEEDETDLEIDTAEITYSLPNTPISLTGGQLYVPFGHFETALVSDPLTLELGETRETALTLNYDKGPISGSLYAFDGDVRRGSGIQNWGANIAYQNNSLTLGLAYINNLGDSDSIQDTISSQNVTSFSDGITANITYTLGAVSFIGEYLGALSSFNDPIFNGSEPSATNLEIDYNFTTFGKATTLIAAYQTTNQSLALELPEAKFLLGLGIDFNEHLSVSLEYSKAKDYGINDGGTGEKVDTYIAQVAASF